MIPLRLYIVVVIALRLIVVDCAFAQRPIDRSDIIEFRRRTTLPDEKDRPLFEAAAKGDVVQLNLLLKTGADINAVTAGGDTAASVAAINGHFETVSWILAHGFEPERAYHKPRVYNKFAGQLGDFVLYEAAAAGRTDIVAILVSRGVLPARDPERFDNASPLVAAIAHRHLQCIEILLKSGSSPFERDAHGLPALEIAIAARDASILNLLLTRAAQPVEPDKHSSDPLKKAAEANWADGVRMLLRHGVDPSSAATGNVNEPFLAYAKDQAIREIIIRQLVTSGRSTDRETENGVQLILAIDRNDNELFSRTIKLPGAVNVLDCKGWNPLIHAIRQKRLEMARQLIEAGAAVDIYTAYGSSPLGFAAHVANKELIELMLQHGANPNEALGLAPSPMNTAAIYATPEILNLMIASGGNPNLVRPWTKIRDHPAPFTPLMAACRYARLDNAKILLSGGAKVNTVNAGYNTALHATLFREEDPVEIVQFLLDKGADPNIPNVGGLTPLTVALQRSKLKSAALLKKFGAIEGATTANFSIACTDLQKSILQHDFASARKLIEKGESVHATGRGTPNPPIILAIEQALSKSRSPKNDSEIAGFVQFLLDHGANPNARDDTVSGGEYFTTPLITAVRAGLPLTIRTLIRAGADPELYNSYYKGPHALLRELNFTPELRKAIQEALDEKPKPSAAL